MKNIPLYLPIMLVAATIVSLYFLYKATTNRKTLLAGVLLWLGLQAIISLSGFYLKEDTIPPRFGLLIIPPIIMIALCFTIKKGRELVNSLDAKWLTLLHVARIPVELVLYGLFLQKYVPELMTFEGRNLDILSGITAPFVFYFGYVKKKLSRSVLLAWNYVCLALLFNIVINAMLSAPFVFQQFAFDQPNIGLLYFPFIWLPCFIVPVVLFSHLAVIRQLKKEKQTFVQPANKIQLLVKTEQMA